MSESGFDLVDRKSLDNSEDEGATEPDTESDDDESEDTGVSRTHGGIIRRTTASPGARSATSSRSATSEASGSSASTAATD